MIYFNKEAVEMLHLISEQKKGIPIMKAFEYNAQEYKYGKEVYFNLIKKQIEEGFEITAHFVSNKFNGTYDEYIALYSQDPESRAEIDGINEILAKINNEVFNEGTPKETTGFSVFQWGAILYYAETTRLLPDAPSFRKKAEEFMNKHNIKTTLDHLINNYYEARTRINDKKNYPRDKLNKIIPFMIERYKHTVNRIHDDLYCLKVAEDEKEHDDF